MARSFRLPGAAWPCIPLALSLLGQAGCQSDRHGRDRQQDQAQKEGPSMEASTRYFAGQLEVQVVLNKTGFGERPKPAPEPAPAAESAPSAPANPDLLPPAAEGVANPPATPDAVTGSSDGSGRGHGGGGRRSSGSPSGPRGDSGAAGQIRASAMAPVSFHLRLVNHAAYPVEVEVTDFNSDLGDFVVEPEKLTLKPNETADAEPMTSRLGVTSDAIPLSIEIRLKGDTGLHRREKQVLVLRPSATAATPTGTEPPPLKFN